MGWGFNNPTLFNLKIMARRHYSTFNNIVTDNLGLEILVRVEDGEEGTLRHLLRMNRRQMPNSTTINYMRLEVDWGDGTIETIDITPLYTNSSLQPTSLTHTYISAGDYTVRINQLTDNLRSRPYWITFTTPSSLYKELRVIEIRKFIFNGISIKSLIGGNINPNTLRKFNNIHMYEVQDIQSAIAITSSLFEKLDIKGIVNSLVLPITNMKSAFKLYKYNFNLNELTDSFDLSQVTDVTSAFAGCQNMIGTGQSFIDRLPSGIKGNPYYAAYLFQDCKNLSDYDIIDELYKDN